jgi:hypothetical protein
VYCLYQKRISSYLLSADGCKQTDEEAMEIPLRRQSEMEIVQQLYRNDNIIREVGLFFIKMQ